MRAMRLLILPLGLGGFLFLGVDWAAGIQWPGATSPVNLSQSNYVRGSTLDVSPGEVVVAWANGSERRIYWTQNDSSGWAAPQMLTPTANAWVPHLVLSDAIPFIAWVEGTYPFPGTIYERGIIEETAARAVMTDTYGTMAPRLAVGNGGLHMVFAATHASSDWDKGDLYYAFRPFTATTWPTPTVAVTRTQVVPGATGGVWLPRLALGEDSSMLHLVWEQTMAGVGGDLHSVWHISGTWGPPEVAWGEPVQLSPPAQVAVRPNVGVDGSGRVHAVWAELVGEDISRPDAQYVNYRRLDGGQWTEVTRLDTEPVLVNTINPTWVRPSLDAVGEDVCVAWHGYRSDAVEEKEEVLLRYSSDGGQTWGPVVNASWSPESLSLYPVLALAAEKRVHLAWEEYQGGGDFFRDYDVLYIEGPADLQGIFLPIVLRGA